MKANNIQEYLGSLQQVVVTSWRKHLKSSKHSEHVILNDFYDDMLDAVDELTEAYMAHNGKVEGYINLFKDTKAMSAYEYVKTIHDFIDENRELVGDESELQSLVDDVLNVCDTAMYKLKELVGESKMMDLKDYITEAMKIEESKQPNLGKLKSKCQKLMKMDHKNEAEAKKAFDKLAIDDYSFDDFCKDLNTVLNSLYDHVFDTTDSDAVYDFNIYDEVSNIADYEFDDNADDIAMAIVTYWNSKR